MRLRIREIKEGTDFGGIAKFKVCVYEFPQ
jgi:hypothetical protein